MDSQPGGALNATEAQGISSMLGMNVGNTTASLLAQLKLANSTQMRVSIITVGAFNIAAALLMVGNILYDSWCARRGNKWSLSWKWYSISIHPAEVFPLVMSVAVIIQGSILLGVQSGSLETLIASGCTRIAQLVWPSLWIVAYTMLVFGIEATIRSLRRARFGPRSRWNVPICIGAILVLLIITWIPSFILPARNNCMASVIWRTLRYTKIAIGVASGLMLMFMISAAIITFQLFKTVKIDENERIAATRVVYYLIFNVFILAFLLPFYIQIILKQKALDTSHIAEVVLNLNGFINIAIHSFLRSNAHRSALRPVEAPWSEKRRLRIFGPSDLDIGMHITTPVLLHRSDSYRGLLRPSEKQSPLEKRSPLDMRSPPEKRSPLDMRSPLRTQSPSEKRSPLEMRSPLGMRSHPETRSPMQKRTDPDGPRTQYAKSTLPLTPKIPRLIPLAPPPIPMPAPQPARASSRYSVFPTRASVARLSASTTFSNGEDSILQAPAPLFARRHRRDDSEQSSETVQIGLRLSHAMQASRTSSESLQLPLQAPLGPFSRFRRSPSSLLSRHSSSDQSLQLPIQQRSTPSSETSWPIRTDSLARRSQRKSTTIEALALAPLAPARKESPDSQQSQPTTWPLPAREIRPTNSWI